MSGPFFVPASTPIAALRSFLTYVVIVFYIAIVGPPGLFVSWVFQSKRVLYWLGHGGVGMALFLAGIRYKVVGRENVPPGAVVYCSNHESNVDPAVLFQGLHPMLHIFYKAELHKVPLMGTAFDIGGFVAVERADRH
jgi:1-acyl-sn-glycerol-3-phosphate acyltransferase